MGSRYGRRLISPRQGEVQSMTTGLNMPWGEHRGPWKAWDTQYIGHRVRGSLYKHRGESAQASRGLIRLVSYHRQFVFGVFLMAGCIVGVLRIGNYPQWVGYLRQNLVPTTP